MKPNEIIVGDTVQRLPSKSNSGFVGKVYKASRVNLGIMSKYQFGAATPDNPPVDLDLGKQPRSVIDWVFRGAAMYKIEK